MVDSIILFVVVSFYLENFAGAERSELLSVVAIYRHGERNPQRLYPTDSNAEIVPKIWPDGYGQLTNIGKSQQYALGQFLRRRYNEFLPEKYNYKDIRVESSIRDRSLMSASANLAGLYPPVGEQIWNPDLLWMPIPIHAVPEKSDAVIGLRKPCQKYDQLFGEMMKTQHVSSFFEYNQGLLRYLSNNSGMTFEEPIDFCILYDILFFESTHNMTLPEWSTSVFPHEMGEVCYFIWTLYTFNPEMARLRIGPLIDHITNHFDKFLKNVTDTPKFLMISGHDITVSTPLHVLGFHNKDAPQFASTVIFELRSTESGPFVNVFYKKYADSAELIEVTLNDCDFDCRWGKFEEIVEPLRIGLEQHKAECSDV